jgi:hypothetical protein
MLNDTFDRPEMFSQRRLDAIEELRRCLWTVSGQTAFEDFDEAHRYDALLRRMEELGSATRFIGKRIIELLLAEGAFVLRGCPNTASAPVALGVLLGGKFFVPGGENLVDEFTVAPAASHGADRSTSIEAGSFHTDYCTAELPPRFVAIQCIRPDPRHPYFGRNQYAQSAKIVRMLKRISPDLVDDVRRATIQIAIGRRSHQIKLFDVNASQNILRMPHRHLVSGNGSAADGHILDTLNLACNAAMTDCVLNEGDILFLDNHQCAHRRGEASLKIEVDAVLGRSIRTVRFDA